MYVQGNGKKSTGHSNTQSFIAAMLWDCESDSLQNI